MSRMLRAVKHLRQDSEKFRFSIIVEEILFFNTKKESVAATVELLRGPKRSCGRESVFLAPGPNSLRFDELELVCIATLFKEKFGHPKVGVRNRTKDLLQSSVKDGEEPQRKFLPKISRLQEGGHRAFILRRRVRRTVSVRSNVIDHENDEDVVSSGVLAECQLDLSKFSECTNGKFERLNLPLSKCTDAKASVTVVVSCSRFDTSADSDIQDVVSINSAFVSLGSEETPLPNKSAKFLAIQDEAMLCKTVTVPQTPDSSNAVTGRTTSNTVHRTYTKEATPSDNMVEICDKNSGIVYHVLDNLPNGKINGTVFTGDIVCENGNVAYKDDSNIRICVLGDGVHEKAKTIFDSHSKIEVRENDLKREYEAKISKLVLQIDELHTALASAQEQQLVACEELNAERNRAENDLPVLHSANNCKSNEVEAGLWSRVSILTKRIESIQEQHEDQLAHYRHTVQQLQDRIEFLERKGNKLIEVEAKCEVNSEHKNQYTDMSEQLKAERGSWEDRKFTSSQLKSSLDSYDDGGSFIKPYILQRGENESISLKEEIEQLKASLEAKNKGIYDLDSCETLDKILEQKIKLEDQLRDMQGLARKVTELESELVAAKIAAASAEQQLHEEAYAHRRRVAGLKQAILNYAAAVTDLEVQLYDLKSPIKSKHERINSTKKGYSIGESLKQIFKPLPSPRKFQITSVSSSNSRTPPRVHMRFHTPPPTTPSSRKDTQFEAIPAFLVGNMGND